MTQIGSAHEALMRVVPDCCIQALACGDVADRAVRAIQREDTCRRRRSLLSPLTTFWLTLALPLYRALSIDDVFARLLSHARGLMAVPLRGVTDSALAHARERLGAAPLRAFFEDLSRDVHPEASFYGRRVWALDAVVLSVADTKANRKALGRSPSPFPQLRLATLTAARTHEIRAARWVPYTTAERWPMEEIAREVLGKSDLVLMDRGVTSLRFCRELSARGVDFVARVRKHVKPLRKRRRGPGDYEVELYSDRARDRVEGRAVSIKVRMIVYHLKGYGRVRLLTTLLDPTISALEIIALYHERWEVELSYDEIKNHLASVQHGTLDLPLRGRSPAMVEQELWATLSTYNLIRRLIAVAATRRRIDPRSISFTSAVHLLKDPMPLGAHAVAGYRRLLDDLADCRMRRWRRPRRAPRVLKAWASKFPPKKRWHSSQPFDFTSNIRLGAA